MLYKHSTKTLDQIGRELGAQYVLEGSVRRDSGNVRITAKLIQVKDQKQLWARQYDRELKSLLIVQGEITQEIADEIQLSLGDRRVKAAKRPVAAPAATSYEAYDLYLKGRYFWNKRTSSGFKQAAEYFQQAITKDPNYAGAYAGLADTYGLMSTWYSAPPGEFMPKARTAALRALELDETLAEAHASLALIAENYDYDWQTAEKEFRRAIQLNPEYATAHQWYAEYLAWRGRFDEALSESERARQLDPMSLIIATDRESILYYSRQYDRAIAQGRLVLTMDPGYVHARVFIFQSYAQQGKYAEALDEIERGHNPEDSPWTWAMRAYVYGRWGREAQHRHALAEVERLARHSPPVASTPTALQAYVTTAHKDKVMNLLQRAYAEHSPALTALKVDPSYDWLRGDPRFQDLLHRVGLAD
jgi:tetratricopeptide (TPR) repeat protein